MNTAKNEKPNLELVTEQQSLSISEQLLEAGFTVIQNGDDAFTVKSNATGAVVKTNATSRDLSSYLVCIAYVQKVHGDDISKNFTYTIPVHR